MTTITISGKLIKEKELIVIPRKKYEEFVNLEKMLKNRMAEEKDTDEAIAIYKREKAHSSNYSCFRKKQWCREKEYF